MAVIVEQEGQLNYRKVRCDECKSVLKYLASDEKQTNHMDGYFGPESIWSVVCPVCGIEVVTRAMGEDGLVDYRIK